MALVGGGGAPNVPGGSNPAGTGTSINYIGDHAYAYASSAAASTSSDTRLSFTTGALYIVAKVTCNGSADPTGPGNGNITVWSLTFDSQLVARMKTDSATSAIEPVTVVNDIIIPPYTTVILTSQSNGDSAGRLTTCSIVGRVYA
tara:strand:+ start:187 stop:621 length:435 start_codon:yes stop_codon:yes gene_type:complete